MTNRSPLKTVTRRHVLQIIAGTLVCPAMTCAGTEPQRPLTWQGTALGARASLLLFAEDHTGGHAMLKRMLDEVHRLERIFSLYRPDSALVELNRQGQLSDPPPDLVHLLTQARAFSELSGGAFDVTVQPLWNLYAEHFRQHPFDLAGPPPSRIDAALELVDYRAIDIAMDRIGLARPGMSVTLNGIAQGYITDRVADLLRQEGYEQVLVNLGELRALGAHPRGLPWEVGVSHPGPQGKLLGTLDVTNGAVATSAGLASPFDRLGRFHHLFNPRTGDAAGRYASLTVVAKRATLADALSTALYSMPAAAAAQLVRTAGPVSVYMDQDDRLVPWRPAAG